jgi:pyruvate formate lyase activating enzyme
MSGTKDKRSNIAETMYGMVLNIQRFSVHDGPGIRTLVFMKGCPLRCLWCSNPESQKADVQLRIVQSRCVGCGKCLEVCPSKAIRRSEEGVVTTDRKLCTDCGKCVDACLYEVRAIAGKCTTVEELLKEVEKDKEFYANSGGGVTVSGGEPTLQYTFVRAFLKRCQERWLHTAIETCGYAPWKRLEALLEYVDFLLYDIKHMDPLVHKRITGVSNRLVLKNLERIASREGEMPTVVRIPVIPGLNDSEANIAATAKFVSDLGTIRGLELLPYHRLGMSRYEEFGMIYKLRQIASPSAEHMERLEAIVDSFGLKFDWSDERFCSVQLNW